MTGGNAETLQNSGWSLCMTFAVLAPIREKCTHVADCIHLIANNPILGPPTTDRETHPPIPGQANYKLHSNDSAKKESIGSPNRHQLQQAQRNPPTWCSRSPPSSPPISETVKRARTPEQKNRQTSSNCEFASKTAQAHMTCANQTANVFRT